MSRLAYHALAAATEPIDFARCVRTAVDGFVPHGAYAAAASAAAERGQSAASLALRVLAAAAVDANPIADLMLTAPNPAGFAERWNGFNRHAELGVRTFVDSDTIRRETRERDSAFRAALLADVLPRLTSLGRLDARQRLLAIYGRDDAISDLLEVLHVSPQLDLDAAAASLGCSRRALQRALEHVGLTFRLMRQAVRVTLAGYRLRQPRGTLSEVAQDCGFFDSAHFVRAWRRSCGLAPSVYRVLASVAVPSQP